MITVKSNGDFSKALKYFKNIKVAIDTKSLEKYGQKGVDALRSVTPVDTGLTAESWYYDIENQNGRISINFKNSNVVDRVLIALILQYGHATRNGGWVEGRNYINPVIQPLFDEIVNNAWKEVTRL